MGEAFTTRVNALAGTDVTRCYQCGRCSGNCPMAAEMDLLPHQVVRACLLGQESVLNAETVWLCDGCHTCTERCPREIDVSAVMDALRGLTRRRDAPLARFNASVLAGVRRMGRLNEMPLGLHYHLTARRSPMGQMPTVVELLKHGKLPLLPHRVGSQRRLFERAGRGVKP